MADEAHVVAGSPKQEIQGAAHDRVFDEDGHLGDELRRPAFFRDVSLEGHLIIELLVLYVHRGVMIVGRRRKVHTPPGVFLWLFVAYLPGTFSVTAQKIMGTLLTLIHPVAERVVLGNLGGFHLTEFSRKFGCLS